MKEDIQVAFLILAHNQPRHLYRLVTSLNHDNFHFYIHIDGKSDIAEFIKYPYPENTHFLKERCNVVHEGFSLVEAMIQLLNKAEKNSEIDYFYFLSGWDYPIKSNQFIYDFLKQSYPSNFMSFYPLVGNADFVDNIRKFFFIDFIGRFPRLIQKPLKLLQRAVAKVPVNRSFLPGIIPFRGSAWFCLNRLSVQYILNFLKKENAESYISYFRNSSCADEMFFHTLILNSNYAHYCHGFQEYTHYRHLHPMKNENKAYLHYIDWDQRRENPAHFTLKDFESLSKTSALFARKFNEKKSAEVLAAIDLNILKNE
ncbi:MAG: beta-1,6-N-acetylglucosaminyltransferase [Anaerolineaceae bacterium]